MNLTKKQLILLAIAKEHGFVTISITQQVYNSLASRRQALSLLEQRSYLKGDGFGKWIITEEGLKMIKNNMGR